MSLTFYSNLFYESMSTGWGRGEACTGFWWENLRERDHKGDPGVDGRITLRWIFKKLDVGLWTGLNWLRIDRWRALVNAVMNVRVP
jgi:hypothetical protein